MRATASALVASAASPYTVSVGTATGSPRRISRAASAMLSSSKGRTLVIVMLNLFQHPFWTGAQPFTKMGPETSSGRRRLSGALALQQFGGVDPEPTHSRADFGPFLLEEPVALGIAETRPGAGSDEHAHPALHDDQSFVLEALVGLGDGQRIRLFLNGQRADRRQRITIIILSGEDRVGNHFTKADINGFVVLGAKRHAVLIQRLARNFNSL